MRATVVSFALLCLFELSVGAAEKAKPMAFQALHVGMTEAEVTRIMGNPDQKQGDLWHYKAGGSLTVIIRQGTLERAMLEWDRPVAWGKLIESDSLFEPQGPSSAASADSMPTRWIVGEPEKGQKWWFGIDGQMSRWVLTKPWKPELRMMTLQQIHEAWVAPFTPRSGSQ